jgi:hypothetical protein
MRWYWKLWIALMNVFFLGIILKIPLLKSIPFYPFFISILIFVHIISRNEEKKLLKYLKQNYYETWKEITTIPFFGSGNVNSLRGCKFLFSLNLNKDESILAMKQNIKQLFLLYMISFFNIPIFSILLKVLNIEVSWWPLK